MLWTPKELEENEKVNLVRFRDGRLFSILPTRDRKGVRYTLGDEFGTIEGNPQHRGPLNEIVLLSILNNEGATRNSLGDAQQMRANHRVKVTQERRGE